MPKSPSFMNSAWGASCGSALLPLISLLGDDLPMNSGVLRVVRFQAQEGSLVRPAYPAAVGWGQTHPGSEIINAVFSRAQRVYGSASAPHAYSGVRALLFCQVIGFFRLILSSILGRRVWTG